MEVQCRDCKYGEEQSREVWWETPPLYKCAVHGKEDKLYAANDFCSYGERMTEDK